MATTFSQIIFADTQLNILVYIKNESKQICTLILNCRYLCVKHKPK